MQEKINLPRFNGLRQAFFNELELTNEWFKKAFNNSFSIVKNKFDDLLYTTNEEFAYWSVHPILCDAEFISERITYYPRKLEELQNKAIEELKKLHYSNNKWRPFFNEYIQRFTEFNKAVEKLMPIIKERLELITPNHIFSLHESDFDIQIDTFRVLQSRLENFRIKWTIDNTSEATEAEKKENSLELRRVWPIEGILKEFIEELSYYTQHGCIPINCRIAHYLGNGGTGKTNLSVSLAKQYLQNDYPAIFLPAIKFTSSEPLNQQFLSLLDIKSAYSFSDFLDALDALGKIYNKRIPIILDGLNEAISSHGFLNERLALDMPMIENEILERNNLVLLTTCRSSYKEGIWGAVGHDDKRFHALYGFTDKKEKLKLVRRYFEHYTIQSDFSFVSLEKFTTPLYLKIYCETINPLKTNLVQVTLGFDSLYSIFDAFIGLCDQNVFKRLSKRGLVAPFASNKKIASRVIKELAKYLWDDPRRACSLRELLIIADGSANLPIFKDTITKALLDEELLFIRDWQEGDEFVYLTYDLMAGYFIADYLLESINDFHIFFKSKQIDILIGNDYQKLHPNHEDIINGLCSLLPIRKEIFIHDLINVQGQQLSEAEEQLFQKSIASTILLSPEYIPDQQRKYISHLADKSTCMIHMLNLSKDVLFVTNHPFNFLFWANKLFQLPMNERDCTWTEYIRNFDEDFFRDLIEEFESLQTKILLSLEQLDKLKLVANFLMWTFSSTNASLKEKSANALYVFAIKFPIIFFSDYYFSNRINDPTIFEWMSNVLYNVVVYITKNSKAKYLAELFELGEFIKDNVLNPEKAHVTNHIETRNYNFNILNILIKNVAGLNKLVDLETIKNGYKSLGVTTWKESADLNEKEYRDGNSLIDYHFCKEKMPYIMVGKGSEYNMTPEYKKNLARLRWRAYQLGYQLDFFGEIDKEIVSQKRWGGDFANTERYADKYIDIAYLEYCGYLDANKK